MNRKQATFLGLGVATASALGVAIWLMVPEKEPTYEGKTIEDWMIESLAEHPRQDGKAIEALRQMGEPAVRRLTWMLENEDSALKLKIIALTKKVPALSDLLVGNYWDRYFAARTLGKLGPSARSAIPALERTARSSDRELARAASAALVSIRNEPIEPIIKAYQDRTTTNWVHAYGLLLELGPVAKSAVPALLAELQSTNSHVRMVALTVLGRVGAESSECVPPLVGALIDTNQVIRSLATHALAGMGPLAKPAIPAVVSSLADTNSRARSDALYFIGRVVPPEEFEVLRPMVERAARDTDPGVRGMAEEVLAERAPPNR